MSRWCRGISHELSRHNWSSYWPEEAFEVAGTRRRVNGSKRRRERRKERNLDVISCLRCVVAGVRYIGPNDRPLRAAMRYPHAPHESVRFFTSHPQNFPFRCPPPEFRTRYLASEGKQRTYIVLITRILFYVIIYIS